MAPFEQQSGDIDLRTVGIQARFDMRGHKTGSVQAVFDTGDWDGSTGGTGITRADNAQLHLFRSNDGLHPEGTAVGTITYNGRRVELDDDDVRNANYLLVIMQKTVPIAGAYTESDAQTTEAHIHLVYNGKNENAVATGSAAVTSGSGGPPMTGVFFTTQPPVGVGVVSS